MIWIPLRRSRLGLSLYAIGSNQLAAFRSGVSVGRTKIAAYALTGLFAALGGLALTASTGIGTPVPGPYTLLSVAAIVLGGVSLAGGRGGVFGPIIAVIILQLIRTDMTFLESTRNLATVAQGVDPDRRRHGRQPHPDPAGPGMSGAADARRRRARGSLARWRALFRDRPLIPLLLLLGLLLVVSGSCGRAWSARLGRRIVRSAIPLAILAGCQTLTMLTGGIDLSVGVGRLDVRIRRRDAGRAAGARSSPIARRPRRRRAGGLVNGVGVGVFRVHPLIMTLGMSLVVLGFANVWQLIDGPDRRGVPPEFRWHRLGNGPARSCPTASLVFIPLAAARHPVGLRRTGYGRLLYAIGDNPIASRLSGARSWQVLIVLYVISALLAGIAGFLLSGLSNVASVTLADAPCCPRWPPRSSAGRRSWAAEAATAARSSGR